MRIVILDEAGVSLGDRLVADEDEADDMCAVMDHRTTWIPWSDDPAKLSQLRQEWLQVVKEMKEWED